jgi:hypothetical protein
MSSYRHPLIVEVPPSAGNSDQHQTFLPPKEQIVTVIKKNNPDSQVRAIADSIFGETEGT